jgi:hypothetical protein
MKEKFQKVLVDPLVLKSMTENRRQILHGRTPFQRIEYNAFHLVNPISRYVASNL